jgi:uncharacterized protein YlxP (DUF503 family)
MHVLGVRIDLLVPAARSLKQKRSVIRPVIEGIRSRWNVSVAEVDHQDLHQRCSVGVSLVGPQVGVLESLADQIERFVWSRADIEVASVERRWMELE